MPVSAAITLAALLLSGPSAAAPQPAVATLQPSSQYPIGIQLATVVDHAATLAGQYVVLPPSRISRIVSPTIVEVRDAREHGPYHFGQSHKYDRLLVLVPSGLHVNRGDNVIVAGAVRTVRGANLGGQLGAAPEKVLRKRGNEALLVATSVSTADGVALK